MAEPVMKALGPSAGTKKLLEEMAAPANPGYYSSTGSVINWTQKRYDMLNQLKGAVQKGELSLSDYQSAVEPFMKQIVSDVSAIAGTGSKNASSINSVWQKFQNDGFVTPNNGKWTVTMPFSKTEYSKLPDSVLPTQDDINKGYFDPATAPLNRVRSATPTTPSVNPGPGNPANPATPAQPSTPLTPPAPKPTDLPALPGSGNPLTPDGGFSVGGTPARADEARIAAEAEYQKALRQQTLNQSTAQRAQMLTDLGTLLQKQEADQMSAKLPGIYEDMNTRGLLRSSGLGEKLALEQGNITRESLNQLAQQGLSDREAAVGGASGIQEQYLSDRNSALGRGFSISDFARQFDAGLQLAQAGKPNAPQGKTTGEKVAQGVTAAAPIASAGIAKGA